MTRRILLATLVLALSIGGRAVGQTPPPRGDALAAEGEGRWIDALRIYQHALESDPSRADLWSRVADIEARLGRPAEAIRALEQAASASPNDPAVHYRLAQAYGAANRPADAAASLDRALEHRPLDPVYLRARGAVAVWVGDYDGAGRFYRRAQDVERDPEADLQIGRVSAWTGRTDEAVRHYKEYLAVHPEDADVWIELARAQSWRGNSAGAMEALRSYKGRFGETAVYEATLARVLAAGGRPTAALEVLDPLYRADAGNFDLTMTRTLALAMQRSVPDTLSSLDSLRSIDAARAETRSTERVVRTAVGSSFDPGVGYYSDSDHLEITRISPSIRVMLPSATQISGGYERQILRAPRAGGIGRASGAAATYDTVWAGVSQAVGPATFFGRVGDASAETFSKMSYTAGFRLRASDAFSASLERTDDFFVVSPRTIELGLTQVRHHAEIAWTPTMRSYVGVTATVAEISDQNTRWEFTFEPRYAVLRLEHMNLDIGGWAYRLGTRYDLPNGYYDPHRYESYAVVVYPYFKFGEDTGLSLSAAFGPQREGVGAFDPGGAFSAEVTFGIYREWLLKAGGSYIGNQRLESGAFHGYTGTVVLVRRF